MIYKSEELNTNYVRRLFFSHKDQGNGNHNFQESILGKRMRIHGTDL